VSNLVGKSLNQYRIVAQIGRGGMATVYKAYQPGLDRYVAVKVLPPYYAEEPGFRERFTQEARAVARLRHPNILTVHDFGEVAGMTYIVMEFVEGGTLKGRLERPLAMDAAIDLAIQVGQALDCAHGEGIIHRDVKPANVLLPRKQWALLSDFGIAKIVQSTLGLTKTGVGIGTPEYMSPEQGQGLAIDGRSDIYSLGVVLYEMITGRVPFSADTPFAVVMKHVSQALPLPTQVDPDIPERLERVILKAMAKQPGERFQTAAEMVRALQVARPVVVSPARPRAQAAARPAPPPAAAAPSRAKRRRFNFLWLLAPALLALLAGGGLFALSILRSRTEATATLGPSPTETSLTSRPTATLARTSTPLPTGEPTGQPSPRPKPIMGTFEATLHKGIYNANSPFSALISDLDGDGTQNLITAGALTEYSWIPSPNPGCEWCNEWRMEAYSWDGEKLALEHSGALDVGYDTLVRAAIGTLGGAMKVAGVGNLYPCGSGRAHAGMAVFDATLQNEHYDWGDRRGADPCLHDYASFTAVEIADVDGDGSEEIVAGGSGDSTGGEEPYREWLLAIRTSDGAGFHEELYHHIDHGEGTERLTDLIVADVDGDGTPEIVATGYSKDTGVTRTVLRVMTWDGATLMTEHAADFTVGSGDYLGRLAAGDVDGDGQQEIVLAGRARHGTVDDWHAEVVHWDGTNLNRLTQRTWSFGQGAGIEAVTLSDADRDGQAEIFLAGNVNWEDVPGATGGYGYVHRYADWHLKVLSVEEGTWTEEMARDWPSSRDYDTNDNSEPDSEDGGALGRLYDMDVGDLNGDGQLEVALVGEWVWVGWHIKVLTVPAEASTSW
jgi:serine/threonine protein kinase